MGRETNFSSWYWENVCLNYCVTKIITLYNFVFLFECQCLSVRLRVGLSIGYAICFKQRKAKVQYYTPMGVREQPPAPIARRFPARCLRGPGDDVRSSKLRSKIFFFVAKCVLNGTQTRKEKRKGKKEGKKERKKERKKNSFST